MFKDRESVTLSQRFRDLYNQDLLSFYAMDHPQGFEATGRSKRMQADPDVGHYRPAWNGGDDPSSDMTYLQYSLLDLASLYILARCWHNVEWLSHY